MVPGPPLPLCDGRLNDRTEALIRQAEGKHLPALDHEWQLRAWLYLVHSDTRQVLSYSD